MGTRIKDAALIGSLSEGYKIPISDGSNQPKTASVGQIGEFVNQKYGVEQKLSELGAKVSYIDSFNTKKVGKNLFNKASVQLKSFIQSNGQIGNTDGYSVTPFIPIKSGETLHCNNIATYNSYAALYDANFNIIMDSLVKGTNRHSLTMTGTSNSKYVRFTIGNERIETTQVEVGDKFTSFEPYKNDEELWVNAQYGKYGVESEKEVLGKNLFNKNSTNNVIGHFLSQNGSLEAYNGDLNVTHFISIKQGQALVCNTQGEFNTYSCQYDENFNPIASTIAKSKIQKGIEGSRYVRFTYEKADETQVEIGEVATSYEPFKPISKENLDEVYIQTGIGKNLFDKRLLDYKKYIMSNGAIDDTSGFSVTPFIPISNGQTLHCNNIATYNSYAALYDANFNIIMDSLVKGTNRHSLTMTGTSNSKYVRFTIENERIETTQVENGSSFTSYEPYIAVTKDSILEMMKRVDSQCNEFNPSVLNIGLDGDSITDSVSNQDVWAQQMQNKLNFLSYTNEAVGGARFHESNNCTLYDDDKSIYAEGVSDRWKGQTNNVIRNHLMRYFDVVDKGLIPTPDIFILAAGCNDTGVLVGSAEATLAKSITELDRTNAYDMCRWCLHKLVEKFPNCRVFFMPPIQCSPSNTTYYEGLKEKVEEFSKIARHYSVQVIDAYHECGICGEFEGGRWLGSDGLHPNVNGASLLADYVSKELRKNFF